MPKAIRVLPPISPTTSMKTDMSNSTIPTLPDNDNNLVIFKGVDTFIIGDITKTDAYKNIALVCETELDFLNLPNQPEDKKINSILQWFIAGYRVASAMINVPYYVSSNGVPVASTTDGKRIPFQAPMPTYTTGVEAPTLTCDLTINYTNGTIKTSSICRFVIGEIGNGSGGVTKTLTIGTDSCTIRIADIKPATYDETGKPTDNGSLLFVGTDTSNKFGLIEIDARVNLS